MQKQILKLILFCGLALGIFGGAKAYAADYYVSLTGTKTTGTSTVGDWSDANCYPTITAAVVKMSSGDTMTINDGVYTGSANMMNAAFKKFPPPGTAGNYTTIRARNIGQTEIDGQYNEAPFDNSSQTNPQYLHIDGIHFSHGKCGVFSIRGDYNKVTNCGFEDGQAPADTGQCPIAALEGGSGSNGNPPTVPSTYNLFEDDWAWGKGRYGFYFSGTTPGANNSIFRRLVVRQDEVATGPVSGIMFYNGHDDVCQNCIVVDGTDTSASEHYGAFAATANYPVGAPTTQNHAVYGSIGLNNATLNGYQPQVDIATFTIDNSVFWHNGKNGIVTGANTIGTTVSTHVTVGAHSNALMDGINSNPGYTSSWLDTYNSIIVNSGRYGFRSGRVADYVDTYGNASGATSGTTITHGLTTSPFVSALKYLPRIEAGSDLKGVASDGGDIGANILYQIGVSGTLRGDAGWNDLTSTPLWPLPNEAMWSAKIKAYSASGPGGNRGFAALSGSTPTPLTDYIWGYLGNAPVTTASPAGGNYNGTQDVTLSLNVPESASVYYTTDGTDPTTSSTKYTGPIAISANTTLKFFSRDSMGNSEAIKTQTYTIKQTFSISDFTTLISNWLHVETGNPSDINLDNLVNAKDLGIMMSKWN